MSSEIKYIVHDCKVRKVANIGKNQYTLISDIIEAQVVYDNIDDAEWNNFVQKWKDYLQSDEPSKLVSMRFSSKIQ